MKRSIATGLLAVCASAGMALATTTKFTEWSSAGDEPSGVDGAATMKYEASRDTTHVTIVLHDLTPGRSYTISIVNMTTFDATFGTAVANNGGNLTFVTEGPRDLTGDSMIELDSAGSSIISFSN